MNKTTLRTMRDVLIEQVYNAMKDNGEIFFLSADFGAPMLDKLREEFRDRFINVGVAEQNLINVATGLALEGFTIYAYGIAPFLTMRPYEQIRINMSMLPQLRQININMIGVGAGLSYGMSGPTHHCLEDIVIMGVLPNLSVLSPSDWVITKRLADYTMRHKTCKYIRLDGKMLPPLYDESYDIKIENGFFELFEGEDTCIVSTGYMTHKAVRVRELLKKEGITVGVIDFFILKPFNEAAFSEVLGKYKNVITVEEAFINKGGLDSIVSNTAEARNIDIRLTKMGFRNTYVFEIGSRDFLHEANSMDEKNIMRVVKETAS